MPDYHHVHETVRPVLTLSREQRIAHLRHDRWIDYPLAAEALNRLEALVTTPPRTRMPCLLIFGASGMGKTMIAEKFKRSHRPTYDKVRGMQSIGVLAMQMPPSPSQSRFYGQILLALGSPYRPSDRLAGIESLTLGLLRELKPKMIVVDEVHHLLAGSSRNSAPRSICSNSLLTNCSARWLPSVLATPRPPCRSILIASRFKPLELPRWRDDVSYWRFLAAFEQLLPLKEPSRLSERTLARVVLEHSGGITGEITELVIHAAESALRAGSGRITPKLVEEAGSALLQA